MLVRLEYSVGKEVRYLSHLDFLRLFIRALRRARLPVAYSQGFNPHAKVAFGPPLPVGITGSSEYLDVEFNEELPVTEIMDRLGQVLPRGVVIKRGKKIAGKTPSLMAVIERARFEVRIPLEDGQRGINWEKAIGSFMARTEVVVTRHTKDGPRPKEIRQGIYRLEGKEEEGTAVFNMELQVGNRGSVRPDEVIRGLIELEGIPLLPEAMEIRRTGLFLLQEGKPVTPLEIL
ncbi:MAG: DUF2344 domain-containing protein [Clostridia bacterium]|nr:DUF2344 domain-containing protein [Clostridia bacterium]